MSHHNIQLCGVCVAKGATHLAHSASAPFLHRCDPYMRSGEYCRCMLYSCRHGCAQLDMRALYQAEAAVHQERLRAVLATKSAQPGNQSSSPAAALAGIVWTPSMARMYALVARWVWYYNIFATWALFLAKSSRFFCAKGYMLHRA